MLFLDASWSGAFLDHIRNAIAAVSDHCRVPLPPWIDYRTDEGWKGEASQVFPLTIRGETALSTRTPFKKTIGFFSSRGMEWTAILSQEEERITNLISHFRSNFSYRFPIPGPFL